MATNRPDTLDPALLRPGRLDRKVEFGLPDLESRTQIFQIHARTMACERDIRFELLSRLCPNSTGAEIRSVCTEAGMFAIRQRRRTVNEKDFLDAVQKARGGVVWCVCVWGGGGGCGTGACAARALLQPLTRWRAHPHPLSAARRAPQVIKGYSKFSSTPTYMARRGAGWGRAGGWA